MTSQDTDIGFNTTFAVAAEPDGPARAAPASGSRTSARPPRPSVTHHRRQARSRFSKLLWIEYEQDDAEALDEAAREWPADLAADDPEAFLATPLQTLFYRLSEEFAVGEFHQEPEPEPEPGTLVSLFRDEDGEVLVHRC